MTNTSINPLLKPFTAQDGATPFSQIRNEHYLPALKSAIEIAKGNLLKLKATPESPTFENTVVALESCTENVDIVTSVFSNIENANGDAAHRALAAEFYPLLSEFYSDFSLDPALFTRVKEVFEKRDHLGLSVEQKRLLEKTYLGFVRNGALLSEEQKTKIRAIDQELAVLGPKYSENVLNATNQFELWITDKADLAGLPDGAIEAAAMAASAKNKPGQWLFTLQYPSYIPFLTYSQKRHLREKIWRASGSKAFQDAYDNQKNVLRIVELRHQRANLLGYPTHADYVLAERMAQSPQTVHAFLDRLFVASKEAAKRDLQDVKEFAQSTDKISDFQPWDFTYYSEKLKEQKYAFNEEDLRPYFKLENVIEGVFEHARRLYGVTFQPSTTIEGYHPDVKVFEVFDEKTKAYVGLFYADFFPRETKRSGAWMTSYRDQGRWGNTVRRPHISIVCNFTKPTETKPSLLSYDEVRTLFHEFGHALHGLLSQCEYRSLSGTNVYWDFVELPSQIMENWVTEKQGLDLFARHYETGAPIPAELIEKLKRSQKFQGGWNSLRQLQLGTLDMLWHSTPPSSLTDVDAFEAKATESTRLFPKIPGTNTSCSFSHIFAGGYSAGYYSYKWAEVLDADAFEYFLEKGLFNSEVAQKFKTHVLSRGGTEHPMDLYKKFRGREPDPNALLRRDGLL